MFLAEVGLRLKAQVEISTSMNLLAVKWLLPLRKRTGNGFELNRERVRISWSLFLGIVAIKHIYLEFFPPELSKWNITFLKGPLMSIPARIISFHTYTCVALKL